MTYEELKKQATPGPLIVVKNTAFTGNGETIVSHYLADPANRCAGVAGIHTLADISVEEGEANARLLAHCRNNFMRALEALKRYDAVVNEPSLGDVVEESDKVRKLIAELEEVK